MWNPIRSGDLGEEDEKIGRLGRYRRKFEGIDTVGEEWFEGETAVHEVKESKTTKKG